MSAKIISFPENKLFIRSSLKTLGKYKKMLANEVHYYPETHPNMDVEEIAYRKFLIVMQDILDAKISDLIEGNLSRELVERIINDMEYISEDFKYQEVSE